MKRMKGWGCACAVFALLAGTAVAQTTDKPVEDPTYYRLDFVVRELEGGKVVNSRSYSMSISTGRGAQNASIRTGTRVPVPGKDGSTSYIELGINFDCRSAKVIGADLALYVSADITSVAEPSTAPPVIRSNRWGGDVIVPLRKPAILFSSDDAMSKRQMQLELIATPITPR
jgi:hypothetical protein